MNSKVTEAIVSLDELKRKIDSLNLPRLAPAEVRPHQDIIRPHVELARPQSAGAAIMRTHQESIERDPLYGIGKKALLQMFEDISTQLGYKRQKFDSNISIFDLHDPYVPEFPQTRLYDSPKPKRLFADDLPELEDFSDSESDNDSEVKKTRSSTTTSIDLTNNS
jgi:hypothetical protein